MDFFWGGLIAIVAAVAGGLVGALVTKYALRAEDARVDRVSRTLRLYEQWQSQDLLNARIFANEKLHENAWHSPKPLSLDQLRCKLRDSSPTEWPGILQVLHFFTALAAMQEKDAIDADLFSALFGDYINHWMTCCFQPASAGEPPQQAGVDVVWTKEDWHNLVFGLRNQLWSHI